MRFTNFLLRVDGAREAVIADFREVIAKGARTYAPERQKNFYVIDMEIISERFFWMSCEYDDAVRFRDYVVDQTTGEKAPNPRTKNQVEPRMQFFACYDTEQHLLYLNDLNRRSFLEQYLSESLQKEFRINNIYASVDEFCNKMKSIRGFSFTQVDNLFGRNSDIFKQIGDMWGHDLPNRAQLKISYGDVPVHGGGKGIVDKLHRHKDEFENVIVIGCDDEGVEHTFDFSSVLKRIQIEPHKDEDEHYDPCEVKSMLIEKVCHV